MTPELEEALAVWERLINGEDWDFPEKVKKQYELIRSTVKQVEFTRELAAAWRKRAVDEDFKRGAVEKAITSLERKIRRLEKDNIKWRTRATDYFEDIHSLRDGYKAQIERLTYDLKAEWERNSDD